MSYRYPVYHGPGVSSTAWEDIGRNRRSCTVVKPVKDPEIPAEVVVSDDAEECPICYDELGDRNLCVTKCGHKFCMDCATKHLANNTACPMCRTPIIEKAIREPVTSSRTLPPLERTPPPPPGPAPPEP